MLNLSGRALASYKHEKQQCKSLASFHVLTLHVNVNLYTEGIKEYGLDIHNFPHQNIFYSNL